MIQRDGNAFICKPIGFRNPVEENNERRITAALCLARLVHTAHLPLDIITHILSYITSGYESEIELKTLSSASNKLALKAHAVLSKFFVPAIVEENEKIKDDEESEAECKKASFDTA